MPPHSWNRRVSVVFLLTIVLTTCITAVYAGAPELISIQTLLSHQAASYQRRMMTLQGVTRDIEITPPYKDMRVLKCRLLYGQATFILEDGTGSLPVEVFGSCAPQAIDALPKNGDVVLVTALIQVLTTETSVRVLAQATEIRILDPK